jgi:hypothetical protein
MKDHLHRVGQTYLRHLVSAWSLAAQLIILLAVLPVVLVVHGVLPGVWDSVVSDKIEALNQRLQSGWHGKN